MVIAGQYLVSSDKKDAEYELEAKKVVAGVLKVPMMALEDDKLSFEDLIGSDFELAKQNPDFDFEIHYDNDGRAIIDIQENDQWMRGAQSNLNLRYEDKNYTKKELVQWLDKKIRLPLLKKEDKIKFLDKAIEHQLKKRTLSELSVNRFVLADRMSEAINAILEKYAKEKFDALLKKKKIGVKPVCMPSLTLLF